MKKPKRPPMKKPKRLFNQRAPGDERSTATHEAAHAAAAVILGIGLHSVDLHRRREPDGRTSLGRCDYGESDKGHVVGNKEAAWPYLIASMVGALAEDRVHPRPHPENNSHDQDIDIASDFARMAFTTPGTITMTREEAMRNAPHAEAFFNSAVDAAEKFVEAHWDAITKVADALRERKHLTGDEVAAILGYENLNTTRQYVEPGETDRERAVERGAGRAH